MGIGRAFDAVMDWAAEGSALGSFFKMAALATVGTGGILALVITPFAIVANNNNNELLDTMRRIDESGYTQVFNSMAQCTAQHDAAACRQSQEKALDFAESLGSGVSYSSRSRCDVNHGTCTESVTVTPITTYVNNVPITTYSESRSYHPRVVGWQAGGHDLRDAVPLYQSAQPGHGVRKDGLILALGQ